MRIEDVSSKVDAMACKYKICTPTLTQTAPHAPPSSPFPPPSPAREAVAIVTTNTLLSTTYNHSLPAPAQHDKTPPNTHSTPSSTPIPHHHPTPQGINHPPLPSSPSPIAPLPRNPPEKTHARKQAVHYMRMQARASACSGKSMGTWALAIAIAGIDITEEGCRAPRTIGSRWTCRTERTLLVLLLVSNVGRWVVGFEDRKVGGLSHRCIITNTLSRAFYKEIGV